MEKVLFTINCLTCRVRLAVRHQEVIGAILECPKCGSMVEVQAPPGWQPPQAQENPPVPSSPETTSALTAGDPCAAAATPGAKWAFLGIKHPWFWIAVAPIAAVTLCVVAWLTIFSRSNSDNSLPPAVKQADDKMAGAAESSRSDVSKNVAAQPSAEQAAAADQRQATTEAALNTGAEPAANPVAENAPAQTPQPSPQASEAITSATKASETNIPETKTPETNISPAEAAEANAPGDVKNRPAEKVVEQDRQLVPSVTGASKVVKLVAPEAIDVQSRLGEVIPNIELHDMPFGRAIGLVAALSGLPITLDPDAMLRLGVSLHDPITVRLKDATLEEILQEVVAKRGMAFAAGDGQVVVTSPADEREELRRVRYTVSDLAGDEKAALEELSALVQKFVFPESWRAKGGWGTIEADKTALVVTQTSAVHDQILVFCEKLRNARGRPLRSNQSPKRFELAARLQQADSILRRNVSANFHEPAALVDILGYLGQQAEANILIDRQALAAAGLSDKTELSFVAEKQPLSAELSSLLAPLKLSYRAIDAHTLQVSTQSAIDTRMEWEFYSIGKMLGKDFSTTNLIEQVKNTMAGASWNETDGSGSIYFDQPSNTLIVLQSQPVQGRVQAYLKSLDTQK